MYQYYVIVLGDAPRTSIRVEAEWMDMGPSWAADIHNDPREQQDV